MKLSAEYETEQRELEKKVKADQQKVDTYEQNKSDFDSCAGIIRKYVGIITVASPSEQEQRGLQFTALP